MFADLSFSPPQTHTHTHKKQQCRHLAPHLKYADVTYATAIAAAAAATTPGETPENIVVLNTRASIFFSSSRDL